MSIDRSLRTKSSLVRHRNVLTRAERVTRMIAEERFPEGASPVGLPKISNRKAKAGGKKKDKSEGEGESESTTTAATSSETK